MQRVVSKKSWNTKCIQHNPLSLSTELEDGHGSSGSAWVVGHAYGSLNCFCDVEE